MITAKGNFKWFQVEAHYAIVKWVSGPTHGNLPDNVAAAINALGTINHWNGILGI